MHALLSSVRWSDQISWVWVDSLLWKSWTLSQWLLGNNLWRCLGLKRCWGGLQTATLWSSTESHYRCSLWWRNRADLAASCELFRTWKVSQWLWSQQISALLWTQWGRWGPLFRWEMFGCDGVRYCEWWRTVWDDALVVYNELHYKHHKYAGLSLHTDSHYSYGSHTRSWSPKLGCCLK